MELIGYFVTEGLSSASDLRLNAVSAKGETFVLVMTVCEVCGTLLGQYPD